MIELFCDGSVRWLDYENSTGAWAYVVVQDGKMIHEEKAFVEKGATNNRTELTAFLKALEWVVINKVDRDEPLTIYSDSQVVIKGFNGEWGRKANKDIWDVIIGLKPYFDLRNNLAKWVKGHSGNEWNEYVDKLCTSCYPSGPSEETDKKKDWLIKDNKGLLKEILYCLNQIPSTKVNSAHFKNTYDICSEIGKHLK